MAEPATEPTVKHFRLALLWPLRLLPVAGRSGAAAAAVAGAARHGRGLRRGASWSTMPRLEGSVFQERHYTEFVTFLPYVQQFLYGEGRLRRDDSDADAGPPMRVFRRRDIAACALPHARPTRRSRSTWCMCICTSSSTSMW